GRRNGGWVCSTFEMAEDLADHLPLRDDGDEPQHPALAQGTRAHLQGKHTLQEPGPPPIRGARGRILSVHPLLTRGGDDTPTQVAVWRQTAPIAHQMDMW